MTISLFSENKFETINDAHLLVWSRLDTEGRFQMKKFLGHKFDIFSPEIWFRREKWGLRFKISKLPPPPAKGLGMVWYPNNS